MNSKSLILARPFLGKTITIKIDRPIGYVHHKFKELVYSVNYGYVDNTLAPDGGELDAYLLKVDQPVTEYTGKVIAIVHRLTDDDDKLVVIPENESVTDNEINTSIEFAEKYSGSKHIIIR